MIRSRWRLRPFGVLMGSVLAVTAAACGGDPPPYASEVSAGNPVAIAVRDDGTYYFGGHAPFVGVRYVNQDGRVGFFVGNEPDSNSPIPKAKRWINDANLGNPVSLVVESDGTFYELDGRTETVVRIDRNNEVTVLLSPDNGSLTRPHAIAIDAERNVYVTEPLDHRVRMLTPGGDFTVVAGNGLDESSGDGGPAEQAGLSGPTGIAIDGGGNIYVGERSGRRIRRIDTSGIITTIAGTGEAGSGGDGGPAIQAQFSEIVAVAVDTAGNVYAVDRGENRVRRIDVNGVITTFAGTGLPGFDGDLGPAVQAALCFPEGIAVDEQGRVFIADTYNGRIRRVSATGTIATIAGTSNAETPSECRAP